MSGKPEKGGALSSATATETGSESDSRSFDITQARQVIGGLSTATVDGLTLELTETLHQLSIGIDSKVKATKILARGSTFMVVDAVTVEWSERGTGEVKDKHVFVLQFPEGDVEVIMQSDAPPRARLVKLFKTARALGSGAIAGPYKMDEKQTGKANPALIFKEQPGFQARILQ